MRSSLHFPQDEPYNRSPEYEDSSPPLSNHGRAKMQVLYEFEARNAQELTVAQGEILEVRPMLEARKRGGWWEVQIAWWVGWVACGWSPGQTQSWGRRNGRIGALGLTR